MSQPTGNGAPHERTQTIVNSAQAQLALLTHHGQAIAYLWLAQAFTELGLALILEAAPTSEDSGT